MQHHRNMLEIKDHVAIAKENPTQENIRALWEAVFKLQAWYYLPAQEEEGPSNPLVTEIDGQNWLLAFTDFRRLTAFARSIGRRRDSGDVHMLTLDPRQSVERVIEVEDHIDGILFNVGTPETFRAPCVALIEFARHFGLPV